ncbi:MAG: hypothetical protein OK457_00520 [Thaumarchaeota archaeon]|nr:hypothetical protein [Nitrososphaerota archaeon]
MEMGGKTGRSKLTNKNLQTLFRNLNKDFFNNEICSRGLEIRFGTNKECRGCYGISSWDGELLINECLQRMALFVTQTMLHEMAHTKLIQKGYIGYTTYGGHQLLFYAELNRLYIAGAFEGLL